MTEQQDDRDQLRAVADHAEQVNSAVYLAPRSLRGLLDQLDLQERELDYWMTRAYEAEGKLWKAEARIRHLEDTARVLVKEALTAEDARDERRRGKAAAEARIAEEKHLRMKATAAATQAEARIQAVEDVLAHHPYGGPEQEDAIRRALDGDA